MHERGPAPVRCRLHGSFRDTQCCETEHLGPGTSTTGTVLARADDHRPTHSAV